MFARSTRRPQTNVTSPVPGPPGNQSAMDGRFLMLFGTQRPSKASSLLLMKSGFARRHSRPRCTARLHASPQDRKPVAGRRPACIAGLGRPDALALACGIPCVQRGSCSCDAPSGLLRLKTADARTDAPTSPPALLVMMGLGPDLASVRFSVLIVPLEPDVVT